MNDMAYKDTTILETLTGSRLHVLVALAMPDCPQPVTATWLAGRAGLSRQSAETALRRLAEYELVEKVGNKGGAGWLLTANVHQLPFPLRAMFAAATMTNFLPLLSSPDTTTTPQSLATPGLTEEISDCLSLSLPTMTKKLPLSESLCQTDTATVSPSATSSPQMTNILSLSPETMTKNLPLSEQPVLSNVPQLAEPHGSENEMTKNLSLSSGTMTKNLSLSSNTMTKNLPLSDGVPPEVDESGEGMTNNLSLSPATMVKNLPFTNGITPEMGESEAEMTKNLSLLPETMTKNLPLSDHVCLFVDLDLDLIQQQTNNHRARTTKNLSFSA
nr:MarR family transcriptional regulator [Chloroflexota bacterium]